MEIKKVNLLFSMLLYLDTNILIYAIEDSKNRFGKDISSSSALLLSDAITCKHEVVISSWTLKELHGLHKLDQSRMILKMLQKKTIKVEHTHKDIDLATKMNPNHFQDTLHGILALKSGAECIVTRNVRDFVAFSDNILIAKPEELT
ncbi:MAG: PIN domain-containing protein [Candidatus Woesearchaeota archaeon]